VLPSNKAAIDVVGEEEERKLEWTGGKERSCKNGRNEREDKDDLFAFPGGGCTNCETVVGIASV
jgi:hypothetical protein